MGKKFLAVLVLLLFPLTASATILGTQQGGTGSSSPSGILFGNNNATPLSTLIIGSNLTLTGATLSATGGGGSSTFSTTSLSAVTPLHYSQSPLAQFSITQSGVSADGYLSSIDFNTFNNKISSTSLSVTTSGTSGAATYTPSTGIFNIPQYQAGGNYITALTGDVAASGPGSAAATLATVNTNTGSFGGTNSIPTFTVNGKGLITAAGSATPSIPASEITSGTFGTGNYIFPADLTVTGNATTTALFATTASTTKLFGANLQACTSTNALTYSGGLFGCVAIPQGTVTSVSGTTNQITSSGSTAITLSLPNLVVFPSNASSTLFSTTYGSTTNAFFGTATIPSLGTAAGAFLAVNPSGQIIATSTPSGSNSAFSPAANYATVAGLPGYTYVAGVITETLNGALSVDGNNPTVGQRVLVKNESGACTSTSGACNNGLYDVTVAGSGIAAFVLTRDAAYNSSSNVIPGIVTYVISGATLADDFWAMTSAAPITIGVTSLNYTEVSGGGSSISSLGPVGALQTGATQTLATSTTGTDFTITASGNVQSFNLPIASASNTGKLSSTDWTTFNNKGNGTLTAIGVTTNQGVSGSSSGGATPNLTISLGALTGVTSLNGLVVTANTGVITTGTWSGTTVAVAHGGTNQTSFGTNDGIVSYSNGFTQLTNYAGYTVNASGLKATYASTTAISSSGELNVPNSGTVPTLSSGDIYSNTNSIASSSVVLGGSQNNTIFAVHSSGFPLASSSLAYFGSYGTSGTTSLVIANPLHASTLTSFFCQTDVGTAWVGFQFGAGTETTEVQCTTTGAGVTLSSNNTGVGRQAVKVNVGREASNPNIITITPDIEDKN